MKHEVRLENKHATQSKVVIQTYLIGVHTIVVGIDLPISITS
jgi:hypothetical protein